MLQALSTLIQYHDARLVGLAFLVCLLTNYTAFTMMARLATQRSRYPWVIAASVVTGCGAWATHSIALLAFKPGVPVAYDVGLTVVSGLIAVLGSGLGFFVARSTERMALGGAIVGFAIGGMHYVGMAALRPQADVQWDILYFQIAILTGASFGAAALSRAKLTPDARGRIAGALLMTTGICATHFATMAGIRLIPNPSITIEQDTLVVVWFAIALTTIILFIIGLGIVSNLVDQHIHEIEVAKQELETALTLADSANKSKAKFISSITNEIRTPLHAIIDSSETLKESLGPDIDYYRNYIDSILGSGARLLRMVNDIIDISKFDSKQLRLDDEFIDVAECVKSTIDIAESEAARAGVKLVPAIAAGLPQLCGDRKRIQQILINLMSNAIRFAPKGSEVRISAFREGDGLALSVADRGIGMAPENIPKVLKRFGKHETDLGGNSKGVGLGLPIALHLMELHGGTLCIASQPGAGTTVTATFPLRRIVREGQRARAT
jgi:signal transduction histidine kinase